MNEKDSALSRFFCSSRVYKYTSEAYCPEIRETRFGGDDNDHNVFVKLSLWIVMILIFAPDFAASTVAFELYDR